MALFKRHEELKPILQQLGILQGEKDSGIITSKEYDDRVKEVKKNWKKDGRK